MYEFWGLKPQITYNKRQKYKKNSAALFVAIRCFLIGKNKMSLNFKIYFATIFTTELGVSKIYRDNWGGFILMPSSANKEDKLTTKVLATKTSKNKQRDLQIRINRRVV